MAVDEEICKGKLWGAWLKPKMWEAHESVTADTVFMMIFSLRNKYIFFHQTVAVR